MFNLFIFIYCNFYIVSQFSYINNKNISIKIIRLNSIIFIIIVKNKNIIYLKFIKSF